MGSSSSIAEGGESACVLEARDAPNKANSQHLEAVGRLQQLGQFSSAPPSNRALPLPEQL